MRAIVRTTYGSPDVLRLEEIAAPEPGAGDVLVRIRAASVNRADLDYLTGSPAITRMLMGVRRPKVERVGLDAAGEVAAIGSGVRSLQVGDRVYADLTQHGQGAFAEFACAPESAWHAMPANIDFEQAAAVPQSAILALEGLAARGGVQAGDTVLINGASGCVGPFAIRMAKAAGATVTGVCRTDKMDFVRSLGVDHVIDYTRGDYTRSGLRYDRILDPAGNRSVFAVRRALAPGGTYQSYGGPSTGRILQTLILGPLISLFGSRTVGMMLAWKPNDPREMAILGGMLEAGTLAPVIDRHYPLNEVPDALRYLAAGTARGKLVITM